MPSQTSVPVSELVALQRDVERLMSRFNAPVAEEGQQFKPPIDVFVTDDEIVARLEVPGLRAEDIQVTVTGGVLTLSGKRERDAVAPVVAYVVRESSWGSFERQVSLPEGIDPSRVRASYRDGVLEVRLPNLSGSSRREVPIARESMGARGHLFHGAEEATGQAGQPGAGTPSDQAEPSDQGIYAPEAQAGEAAPQLYEGGHIPSQEEWTGRTSSEEESLDEAAEEEREGGTGGRPRPDTWPT